MIKHKMISTLALICCMIIANSCGGSASIESPSPNNAETLDNNEEFTATSNSKKVLDDNSKYQDGDMHISALNLEVKKLQAELDHYKSNLRELSAKSQVWGNPFTVYNKEIILTNGTTVFGKIVYQDRDVVKVETLIG